MVERKVTRDHALCYLRGDETKESLNAHLS